MLHSDMQTALGQLRDVVNTTMGFDALSAATGIPKNGFMRMLSDQGNPRAANLAALPKAIGQNVGIRIPMRAEPAGGLKPAA